jgi:hypothetical protein
LVTAAAPAVPHQPSAVAAATYACLTRQWLSGWPMSTRSFTGVRAQASQACGPVQEEAHRRVPMGRTSILVRRRRRRPRIRHQLSPACRRPSCYTGGAPSAPARARRMERCGWTLRVRYGGNLGGAGRCSATVRIRSPSLMQIKQSHFSAVRSFYFIRKIVIVETLVPLHTR